MKRPIRLYYIGLVLLGLASCVPAGSPMPPRITQEAAQPTVLPSATFSAIPLPATAVLAIQDLPAFTPTSQSTATPLSTGKPLTMPSPTPTLLACWQQGGRYDYASLTTDLMRYPLDVRVYLPPCYDQQPDRRYPVLYLIHGQSFNDDQWDRLGVDEQMDALVASGELPPFLVVMPRDREWSQSDEDPFGEAFLEVLLPWVDGNYRTLTDRRYRAVGGLSRGAGWAAHFGLAHWQLFGAFGGHSLPIFWSDVPEVKKWLHAIPAESMPRIYLDIGDEDRPEITQSAIWFEGLLTKEGIPHEWHMFAGYHDEAYWSSHVAQYLRWYAAEW